MKSQIEKKVAKIIRSSTAVVLSVVLCSPSAFAVTRSPSSFQPGIVSLVKPSKVFSEKDAIPADLLLAYWHFKASAKQASADQYIPLDLQPTTDDAAVASRLADKSLGVWFESSGFRQTRLGRTADVIEKKMQAEVVLNNSDAEIEHKLNFQVQAFQSVAKVKYSGFANATIVYQAKDSELGFELSESIGKGTAVAISHSVKPDDRLSRISLQFLF